MTRPRLPTPQDAQGSPAFHRYLLELRRLGTELIGADMLVGNAVASLDSERVVTDTSTVEWDVTTDGQAKASVVDTSIDTTQLAALAVTAAKLAANAVETAKILDEAVTYAKMQHVSATDKLLGRSTAGAGDVEEIACTAAGRAILDDATASDQRTTLGLGTIATLNIINQDYTVTNGTTSRTLDADDAAGSISASPTQGEVENIRDAVLALADVVGTLISDNISQGNLT